MIRYLPLACSWILTIGSLGLAQTDEPADAVRPSPESQALRTTGEVAVVVEKMTPVLVVHSRSGIGKATVERLVDAWPGKIVVRLHLKGLESFRIRAGDVLLETYVSSSRPLEQYADLGSTRDEPMPIDKRNPYWPHLRAFPPSEQQGGSPEASGYFEVTLPAKLLEGNPRTFELQWVDFFR